MFPLHDDNPTSVVPYVTYSFMLVCIGVFLWQISHTPQGQQTIIYALGVIPAVILGDAKLPLDVAWVPPFTSMFTSMFLHGGWMHLIGNMLYLWVFGNNVEAAMGHVRYLLFYALCGIAAVLAQAVPDPDSQIPMIGASGAISGVLGAYMLLYPQARVLVVIPIVIVFQTLRIPALFVLGIWFVMQLFSSVMAGDQDGGVAFGAHIGGFLAGMALISFFKYKHIPLHIPFKDFHPFSKRG
ncbi:MAG: rhomboid family intramembrane serine protease [Granulosicoccus sp.]|nr:rhomboid family intramembrane serine protease [Granulosicoccus sp.]